MSDEQQQRCWQVLRTAPQQRDLREELDELLHGFRYQRAPAHNAPPRLYRSHATLLQPIITTPAALEEFAAHLRTQPRVGLDTEFLRERTYRAQLCLVQLASPSAAACIDPLALRQLAPLADVLGSPTVLKVMHASRQDLEVLLPIAGVTQPVFDTQIAAGLMGLPAQIGYAEAVRRLLGHELAKSHTRTDWSRRPLSAEQITYALDDVNYLLPLAERLQEELGRAGSPRVAQGGAGRTRRPDAACPSTRSWHGCG